MDLMQGYDLFLRHTDASGRATVRMHRVWHKEAFLAARKAEAAQENDRAPKDSPRLAAAEQITREQYLRERAK